MELRPTEESVVLSDSSTIQGVGSVTPSSVAVPAGGGVLAAAEALTDLDRSEFGIYLKGEEQRTSYTASYSCATNGR